MIRDTEFSVPNLGCLTPRTYAFLWQYGSYDFYFVYRNWEDDKDLYLTKVRILDKDELRDRMWDGFDTHDAWVEAVRNGDTEESYDDWSNDIDIDDYVDEWDFYGVHDDITSELYRLWFWNEECDDYDYRNDYYLASNSQGTLTKNTFQNVLRYLDWMKNETLVEDLQTYFHCNEMENFLDCEDIR